MRWTFLLGVVTLAVAACAQESSVLDNRREKSSYALGFDLGNQLKKLYADLDSALLSQGLSDALSGSKALMSEEQIRAVISELQAELKLKKAREMKGLLDPKKIEENKKAGEAFLAENSRKQGVSSLPSGLQYKVLKAGNGKKPTLADTVVCQYTGRFLDGGEFYNSYKRNQPMTLVVKHVIKGLKEALQLMPVGSKWQLFVPPDLAYGELGSGPVGPDTTLIYEVELVSIK